MLSGAARPRAGPALGLLCAALLLYAPPLAVLGPRSDYAVHAQQAQRFVEHGRTEVQVPAPLFAGLTAGVQAVLRAPGYLGSALLVGWLAHLALAAGLASWLQRAAPARSPWACAGLALATTLLAPIHLPTLPERNLYFGYIGLATYHNPSMTLLRPLALGLYAHVLLALAGARPAPPGRWLASGALAALAALAKPSYSIALLPALALCLAPGLRAGGLRPDWRLLGLAIALPSALVLAGEYAYTFSAVQAGDAARSGIAVAALPGPASAAGLFAKLLLSIAFPALVYALYRGEARHSPGLRLAWLTFAIAALLGYSLAETGPRAGHGNFLWSGQIALFILFAASLRFLLARTGPDRPGRRRACAAAFALHLLCGAIWYAVQLLPWLAPGAAPLREWF